MGEGGQACKLALQARKQWPDEGSLAGKERALIRPLLPCQKAREKATIPKTFAGIPYFVIPAKAGIHLSVQ
jgi:hypothetical protein